MRTYSIELVRALIGLKCPNHKSSGKIYQAYLGDNLFDANMVDEICIEQRKKDWFRRQIELFVEYLNKIEEIEYTDMAKNIGISLAAVSSLRFSYEVAIKILVKYKNYVNRFEEYYEAND